MTKIYEVQVSKVITRDFLVRAKSQDAAEDYAMHHLGGELELSDDTDLEIGTLGIFDTIDEYPILPAPEVIDAAAER